jgi:hypothetical protein
MTPIFGRTPTAWSSTCEGLPVGLQGGRPIAPREGFPGRAVGAMLIRAPAGRVEVIAPVREGSVTTIIDEDRHPGTHARVVGVGTYRYLEADTRSRVRSLGLESLTSSPVPAARVVDWLLEELHNDQAPLGSVELLMPAAWPGDGRGWDTR